MGYRRAAERPGAPRPPRPRAGGAKRSAVVVIPVARYAWWNLGLLLVLGALGVAAAGYATYERLQIACSRPEAGAEPRCEVVEHAGFSVTRGGFALGAHSVSTEVRILSEDTPTTFLVLPEPRLERGVPEEWAREVVSEMAAFHADPTRTTWSAERRHATTMQLALFGGVFLLGLLLVIPFRTRIVIDPEAQTISATTRAVLLGYGGSPSWTLDRVSTAHVRNIDESEFKSLVLVVEKEDTPVATGTDGSCSEAAKRIAQTLSELRRQEDRAERVRSFFEGWSAAEDGAKWKRLSGFLGALRLDDANVVRLEKEGAIELRARRASLPVRVRFDVLSPAGAELTVVVRSALTLHVRREEGAPSPAAEAFVGLPRELQEKLALVMDQESVEWLAVERGDVRARCERSVLEHEDPLAHVTAVLDALVEVGTFVASLPPAEEDKS